MCNLLRLSESLTLGPVVQFNITLICYSEFIMCSFSITDSEGEVKPDEPTHLSVPGLLLTKYMLILLYLLVFYFPCLPPPRVGSGL